MAKEIGEITIKISEEEVTWETEFDIPDVVFWLETTKAMVINRHVLSGDKEDQ